ncbi:MAG: HAD family hydrolase [Oscillospiraceae bacterium]
MVFSKFKGIIFDLDGTLISSESVWSDIDYRFLKKRGYDVPHDYCKVVSAMNFYQAAVYTNDRFNLKENLDDIQQEWADMAREEYAHNIPEKPGAGDFLRRLKEKNIKIALATASSEPLYKPVLERLGMYDYFDFFAVTDNVKRGKGFPDIYEYACKGLGLKTEDCAVFEDIIEAVRGAKAGGFYTVACLDRIHKKDCEEMKKESDFYFYDYDLLEV